jgi:hypothetical protein
MNVPAPIALSLLAEGRAFAVDTSVVSIKMAIKDTMSTLFFKQ